MEVKNRTISLIVKNRPDVLARIAGTFSGRGFNIENISANVTMDPSVTKITIVTTGDSATVLKIEKQLRKLVDIITVNFIPPETSVQREMILIRIKIPDNSSRSELLKLAAQNHCRVIGEGEATVTLECTGASEEIDRALSFFKVYTIEDMSRSGIVAL
ncbi:MAG: acetolactate synthase small subunit [Deltaproteobacteria bacterium]|nr:acetolactate synthase small subunit [Deltaproteobacteria bacterium]